LVEESASSGVYTLLKREDEKYITEKAFDNPRFVEDLVREVYLKVAESLANSRAFPSRPRISRASTITPPTPS
jgi:GTP cyclohydrolase FolE2